MSVNTIDLRDAQTHLLKLVEQAKHGQEVILMVASSIAPGTITATMPRATLLR